MSVAIVTFGSVEEVLDLLDELFDVVGRPLEFLFVRVQGVPEVGRVLEALGKLQG